MMFEITWKINRKHISIVLTFGCLWVFNFYWEPWVFQNGRQYKAPNIQGLWFVLLDIWVI